ncbi:MAG: hypothetical protein U0103_11675 [Candidatus Obscuribacterales bacterium]
MAVTTAGYPDSYVPGRYQRLNRWNEMVARNLGNEDGVYELIAGGLTGGPVELLPVALAALSMVLLMASAMVS